MSAFSDARDALVLALDGVPANVYGSPPEVVTAPAVVLVVADPMAELVTVGSRLRFRANYRLQLVVAPMQNLAALEALEDLVVDVLAALPSGVGVGPIGAPTVLQVGQSDQVVIEIPVQIMAEQE